MPRGGKMVPVPRTGFWDKDGYKLDVERITENVAQIDLLNKFFAERSEVEAEYAKRLKSWKSKYENAFSKSSMYGSHQQACTNLLSQTQPVIMMHEQMSEQLMNDCSARVSEILIKIYFYYHIKSTKTEKLSET
jgi:hypothetical protein